MLTYVFFIVSCSQSTLVSSLRGTTATLTSTSPRTDMLTSSLMTILASHCCLWMEFLAVITLMPTLVMVTESPTPTLQHRWRYFLTWRHIVFYGTLVSHFYYVVGFLCKLYQLGSHLKYRCNGYFPSDMMLISLKTIVGVLFNMNTKQMFN